MLPGHRALYYLLFMERRQRWPGRKGWDSPCMSHVFVDQNEEFAVNNIVGFYGDHDDPGAGIRFTIHDPKIVTSLILLHVIHLV